MNLSTELPIKKVESVELVIDSLKRQIKFPDIETLRNKKIRVIDVFRRGDITKSPNQNNLVEDAVFNKSFLVLSSGGKEIVNRVPLKTFNPYDNSGRRVLLDNLVIDWVKSYIEIGDTVGVTAGDSYLLNVYYE